MRNPDRDPTRTALAPTRVIPVPAGDLDFGRFVRAAAADRGDPATLEATLRSRYPRARVHPNDLSGFDAVLYAYRDGRWEPNRSG